METHLQIMEKAKAGYAALYLLSPEEQRSLREIKKAAQELGRVLCVWTPGKGLMKEYDPSAAGRGGRRSSASEPKVEADTETAPEVLESMLKVPNESIVVLRLYHHFMDDPLIQSQIMDIIPKYKLTKRMIVVLTPVMQIPQELEKEFALIEASLPTKEELKPVLEGIVKNLPENLHPAPERREELVEAALGLTTMEAENAFSLSIVRPRMENPTEEEKIWLPKIVLEEKCQALKKTGILEYIPTDLAGLSEVGGMDNLKEFVRKRKRAFSQEAAAFGLPPPKGILLIGPPGTGKSLGAKAISVELTLPLLKLDMGKVYSGLVGSSEANIRMALRTAEAVAPCTLWIDEVEKGMAGGSGALDSGVGARVLGTILTWMQEKTAPVFVYATANRPNLPAELVRKGRFDEMFSVDLPDPEERSEIFRIHLSKRGLLDKVIISDADRHYLVEASELFTGAEIEAAIVDAMYSAFDESREVTSRDVIQSLDETQPQAKIMAEDINRIREWCSMRTRPANRGKLPSLVGTINQGGRTVDA